jgi:hypothetical protein
MTEEEKNEGRFVMMYGIGFISLMFLGFFSGFMIGFLYFQWPLEKSLICSLVVGISTLFLESILMILRMSRME